MLIDFPSGIGQFSPGWVESKFLEQKGAQVARDKVLSQQKKAAIAPTTKAATSAAPTASAKPTASAVPTASASAAIAAAAKSAAPLLSAAKTVLTPEQQKQLDKAAADAAAKARAGTGGTAPR